MLRIIIAILCLAIALCLTSLTVEYNFFDSLLFYDSRLLGTAPYETLLFEQILHMVYDLLFVAAFVLAAVLLWRRGAVWEVTGTLLLLGTTDWFYHRISLLNFYFHPLYRLELYEDPAYLYKTNDAWLYLEQVPLYLLHILIPLTAILCLTELIRQWRASRNRTPSQPPPA